MCTWCLWRSEEGIRSPELDFHGGQKNLEPELYGGYKRISDPPELEFLVVFSLHAGAGNKILVLYKSTFNY